MKKLLFGILLFNVSHAWAAVTITAGSVGLMKISTGSVQGRNWGDMLNSNSDVIAATFTTIFNNLAAVAQATATLVVGGGGTIAIYNNTVQGNATTLNFTTNLTATCSGSTCTVTASGGGGGISGADFILHTTTAGVGRLFILTALSTTSASIDFLKIFTSTVQTDIDKYKTFSGTTSVAIDFLKVFTSTVQIDIDKYKTFSGTTSFAIDFLKTNASTTSLYNVALGTSITGVYNLLTATSSNLADNTGTINTVGNPVDWNKLKNVPASVISAVSVNVPKPYDLIIGSYGAVGIDMIVDTTQQWQLALSSIGANGLTFSTTVQATILSKAQNCMMAGSTIPAGITVIGSDSSTWVDQPAHIFNQFLNVYGKVINMNLNFGNGAFKSPKIQMSSFSKLNDCTEIGMGNQATGIINDHGIFVQNAIDVEVINNRMLEVKSVAGVAMYGDTAPLRVLSSSNVVIDFRDWQSNASGGLTGTYMQVSQSTRVTISGNFYNLFGDFLNFAQGNVDCGINERPNGRDSYIEYSTLSPGDVATIFMGDSNGTSMGVSSTAWVKNVQMVFRSAGTSDAIKVNNNAGRDTTGFTIKNVTITCYDNATGITGIHLLGGSLNTLIDNVDVFGCTTALSDSGRNTNKAGLRKNGVTQ